MPFLSDPPPQIPEPNRQIFSRLARELLEIKTNWVIFKHLFSSDRCVALLTKTAPELFQRIRILMVKDFILTLSRITDPSETGGDENLTLRTLLKNVPEGDFKVKLVKEYNRIKPRIEVIRTHRNKWVAHADLATSLKTRVLPRLAFGRINEALDLIEEFLETFRSHYLASSFLWNVSAHSAEQLFERLCMAEAYDNLERSRAVPRHSWKQYWVPASR